MDDERPGAVGGVGLGGHGVGVVEGLVDVAGEVGGLGPTGRHRERVGAGGDGVGVPADGELGRLAEQGVASGEHGVDGDRTGLAGGPVVLGDHGHRTADRAEQLGDAAVELPPLGRQDDPGDAGVDDRQQLVAARGGQPGRPQLLGGGDETGVVEADGQAEQRLGERRARRLGEGQRAGVDPHVDERRPHLLDERRRGRRVGDGIARPGRGALGQPRLDDEVDVARHPERQRHDLVDEPRVDGPTDQLGHPLGHHPLVERPQHDGRDTARHHAAEHAEVLAVRRSVRHDEPPVVALPALGHRADRTEGERVEQVGVVDEQEAGTVAHAQQGPGDPVPRRRVGQPVRVDGAAEEVVQGGARDVTLGEAALEPPDGELAAPGPTDDLAEEGRLAGAARADEEDGTPARGGRRPAEELLPSVVEQPHHLAITAPTGPLGVRSSWVPGRGGTAASGPDAQGSAYATGCGRRPPSARPDRPGR